MELQREGPADDLMQALCDLNSDKKANLGIGKRTCHRLAEV
jgi:hypothetical protein